jgi:predicted O-linked N-acetylglucosamine transferase (SPINDLY family)
MTLFLSHGNMITSDYTLVMKHEEGHTLITDLIAKGLAFAKLHSVDLSQPTVNRNNIEKLFSNLFLNMNYFESSNPNILNAVKYFQEYMPELKLTRSKPTFEKITGGRKLRIGFLSGDYVYHPVSYVLNGIVEHLDKSKFEVYLFSTSRKDSSNKLQEKMRSHATQFLDLKDDVDTVIDSIVDKDIDVLVEMCGHTTNGTTLINALRSKPARVVAQYFAFPNTYGLKTVDYKIGDSVVFPPGLDRYYTEKFCEIKGGMHTYKPIVDLEVKRIKNTHITFGCFNNPKKFRPEWIKSVCKILKAVTGSKLKLRYFNLDDPSIVAFYTKEFEKHGISKERLDIGLGETLMRYFESYADVDIVLDPWPYNGGTINIEALYCSRPYITLLGNSYVSRVGASLLHQVGFPELIAKNADDYVTKAIMLANDSARLDKYIEIIRPAVMKSTLCDNAAFTREFEKGLIWMLKDKKWFRKPIHDCD